MKRMYVVLGTIFFLMVLAINTLAQKIQKPDSQIDEIQKRLQLREEVHKRMMEKLLHGLRSDDDDLFKDMDKLFEGVSSDSFSGFDSYSNIASSHFEMAWTETASGRTLTISPQNKEQRLDINVEKGMVIIKGQTQRKSTQGKSFSSFSNSVSVPADCDWGNVKMEQKDGKILMHFPYISSAKPVEVRPEKDQRRPLPPSQNDVPI